MVQANSTLYRKNQPPLQHLFVTECNNQCLVTPSVTERNAKVLLVTLECYRR